MDAVAQLLDKADAAEESGEFRTAARLRDEARKAGGAPGQAHQRQHTADLWGQADAASKHYGWHWWTPLVMLAVAVMAVAGLVAVGIQCVCAWTWQETKQAVLDVRHSLGIGAAVVIALVFAAIAGSCLALTLYVAQRII